MPAYDILLGPILGYEWDEEQGKGFYTVIARVSEGKAPVWHVNGQQVEMKPLTQALSGKSRVWRGELQLSPFEEAGPGREVRYSIERGGKALKNGCGDAGWGFHLPGKATPGRQPRVAFCSCNGFTDPNAMRGINPLQLWERMHKQHLKQPLSLLLMGGDQLYCDDLARKEGSFARLWTWLKPGASPKKMPTQAEFSQSYFDHYLVTWARVVQEQGGKMVEHPHTAMVNVMASVPSVMMWDDHDIFDGWGSYQSADSKIPYYKEAFAAARDAFGIYQVRGEKANRSLLDRKAARPRHYSQGLKFGPFDILVMDNRSHRTAERVMDATQWSQIESWLAQKGQGSASAAEARSLLVVSPVPVVYRRFHNWVSELPGEHGGEDDLRDHWSHHTHEGERDRLVYHLFKALKHTQNETGAYQRVTLLSGDVHVGALGFLERTDNKAEIAQVISSAIMHPAPGLMAWEGLKAISSDADHSIQGLPVVAKMTRPVGAKDRYLRCRNFAWLQQGSDNKLWINWECENLDGKTPEKVEFALK